ncbi:MAG: hypothetical protein U0X92_13205 [Anaerolineales bacterium]
MQFVAGLDEAGRGALAGPVAVGAVILPRDDKTLLSRTLGTVARTQAVDRPCAGSRCAGDQRDRAGMERGIRRRGGN